MGRALALFFGALYAVVANAQPLSVEKQILIIYAEALSVFVGRQPSMIVRRSGRLLLDQQFIELGFLDGGGCKRDRDVGNRHRWRNPSLVVLCQSLGMHMPAKRQALSIVDWPGDVAWLGGGTWHQVAQRQHWHRESKDRGGRETLHFVNTSPGLE